MENRALVFALGLIVTASCSLLAPSVEASEADENIHCDETSGLCFRVDAVSSTCRAQSWVGRARFGRCPTGVKGYHGRWALRGDDQRRLNNAGFCRYQWASESNDTPDAFALRALSKTDELSDFEPDCEVVEASAQTIDATWPELQRAFFTQTERIAYLPAGDDAPAPVRVEIVDSAVTRRHIDGEPSYGQLGHGRAMGLIVRKLACPAGGVSCRADVASTLALPLVAGPKGAVRDVVRGGFFGSMTDLAVAVEDAVDDWQTNAANHRLVINLSLGWEPAHGGAHEGDPSKLTSPVRAVWNAIARARCLGAAVVAAAGNRSEGPENPEGPLFPAGWAAYPRPTPSACLALGVTSLPEDYSTSAPFVFAVGGVEANDADLALGRAQSRPALVAPAAHAVVADEQHDGPSAIQTGTSVAAAVASAAAAVVWSYRPELTAAQVMDLIYAGGAETGRPALVCRDDECGRMARRVSICGAVEEACAKGLGLCPDAMPTCERLPGGRVARPKNLRAAIEGAVSAKGIQPMTAVGWPCKGQLFAIPGAPIENPCPASQVRSGPIALGAVGPQPGTDPPCPHCDFDRPRTILHIEIAPDVQSTLTNPVLAVVVDSATSEVNYYDLSSHVPPLTGGDEADVTDLDIGSDFESATIEWVVDGTHAIRNPVIVW